MKRSDKKIISRGGRYVPEPEEKEKMSLGKKIGLGVFFTIGTLIIVSAVIMLTWLFGSGSLKPRELTDDFGDFIQMYENNQADRDLPNQLQVTDALLTADTKNGSYNLSLNIVNESDTEKNIGLQLYFNEEYNASKNQDNPKAFFSVPNDGTLTVASGEKHNVSVKGSLTKGLNETELQERFDYIYLEIACDNQTGRVMIPVKIEIEGE